MNDIDPTRTRDKSALELHPVARLPEEWEQWASEHGEPRFRAKQIFRWIHQRGIFAPEEMTDLKKELRQALGNEGVEPPMQVERVLRSTDGTRKLLLRLSDQRAVECVLIPMSRSEDADVASADLDEDDSEGSPDTPALARADTRAERITLCVSTQVGCAMGCVFCASGKAGLTRGLGAAEIVTQLLLAKRYLDPNERLRNVVFMGMGEPLHHYDETLRALRLITHPDGIGMSPRRITVSTVGLVPNIQRLGADFAGQIGLAVSLHAPDDETRNRIMPINRRYDVGQLLDALRRYPLPQRRRITIEYTLMRDLNDSPAHAHELARRLSGSKVKVNLIPMNPIEASELKGSEGNRVEQFRSILAERRISCSVRKRRGDDVDAACGQLALRAQQPNGEVRALPVLPGNTNGAD